MSVNTVAGISIAGINEIATTHYFVMNDGSLFEKKGKQPTYTQENKIQNTASDFIAWGKKNNEPEEIINTGRSIVEIESGLDLKGRLLYGNGYVVGRVTGINENGEEIFTPIFDLQIENFLKQAGFHKYFLKATQYFYWIPILFPELILTNDKKKIAYCNLLETEDCRWQKPNEKTGIVENLYVSANWKSNSLPDDAVKIDALNPFFPEMDIKTNTKFRYIYPLSYPSIGNRYYPVPSWNALRVSNWLAVARLIPNYKATVFANSMGIKYHIETTREWWEWKYDGFAEMSPEERIKIIRSEKEQFENAMAGADNHGKSIFTTGYVNDRSGVYYPGWKINELSNKWKRDEMLDDANEAKAQLLMGLGIPSSLLNILGSGTGMSAGSGTDIRVAYNLYINTITSHRDLILEPWNFILKFNGYGDDIRIKTKYNQITTLENKAEQQPTV